MFFSCGISNDVVKSSWPTSFFLSLELVTGDRNGTEVKHQMGSSSH